MERLLKSSQSTASMNKTPPRRKVRPKSRRAVMTTKKESAWSASARTKIHSSCHAAISACVAIAAKALSRLDTHALSADSTLARSSRSSTSEEKLSNAMCIRTSEQQQVIKKDSLSKLKSRAESRSIAYNKPNLLSYKIKSSLTLTIYELCKHLII